jgi:hypothetical protein
MNKYILILIYCAILLSCKNKSITKRSINNLPYSEDSLKNDILYRGDTNSYKNLRIIYLDYPTENMLFWSLIMANKYNYSLAYSDVYHTLLFANGKVNPSDIDSLDSRTKEMALEYLNIAAKMNDPYALGILKNFPGFIRSIPISSDTKH